MAEIEDKQWHQPEAARWAAHVRDLSMRGHPKSSPACSNSVSFATPRKLAVATPAATKCSFCLCLSCIPSNRSFSCPFRFEVCSRNPRCHAVLHLHFFVLQLIKSEGPSQVLLLFEKLSVPASCFVDTRTPAAKVQLYLCDL